MSDQLSEFARDAIKKKRLYENWIKYAEAPDGKVAAVLMRDWQEAKQRADAMAEYEWQMTMTFVEHDEVAVSDPKPGNDDENEKRLALPASEALIEVAPGLWRLHVHGEVESNARVFEVRPKVYHAIKEFDVFEIVAEFSSAVDRRVHHIVSVYEDENDIGNYIVTLVGKAGIVLTPVYPIQAFNAMSETDSPSFVGLSGRHFVHEPTGDIWVCGKTKNRVRLVRKENGQHGGS